MSTPSGSGRELVPVAQEGAHPVPMEVNGTEQTGPAPRVEEPDEGQAVGEQRQQPGGQRQAPAVDRRVFIHAPQYHWHAEGEVDEEARAALEKLHRDTFQFAQETVGHGEN